jgi:GNAT superfamily N-acetyltransferase
MSRTRAASLLIRPYDDADETQVLGLLRASLGEGPAGERSPGFFRWKHLENPFGRSYMLLAEADSRVVGLRAFMRWRFVADGEEVRAVRAVDTATHPDYQGRGIFSMLTLKALEQLREDTDLVFNTPNEKSLPGYLKMGWRTVGAIPVKIRVRHPIRFARGFRSSSSIGPRSLSDVNAPAVSTVLSSDAVRSLLESAGPSGSTLATPLSVEYLHWRFSQAPLLDYRAIGDEHGFVIFRLRNRGPLREASIACLIVPPDAVGTARRLLASVARIGVDHLTASFPRRSTASRAALRSGFVPSPKGVTFVTNVLRPGIGPDPTQLSSWGLTLGDMEVF